MLLISIAGNLNTSSSVLCPGMERRGGEGTSNQDLILDDMVTAVQVTYPRITRGWNFIFGFDRQQEPWKRQSVRESSRESSREHTGEHSREHLKYDYDWIIIQVLLVTGGQDSGWNPIASTEVYCPSAGRWRKVRGGALPRPMAGVRVVTLNNRVLLFGMKGLLIQCH